MSCVLYAGAILCLSLVHVGLIVSGRVWGRWWTVPVLLLGLPALWLSGGTVFAVLSRAESASGLWLRDNAFGVALEYREFHVLEVPHGPDRYGAAWHVRDEEDHLLIWSEGPDHVNDQGKTELSVERLREFERTYERIGLPGARSLALWELGRLRGVLRGDIVYTYWKETGKLVEGR